MSINNIMQLANNAPTILSMIDKGFFLTICFFLASFSWRGWSRYKNWGISIIATIGLGFAITACSILLAQIMPFELPFIKYAMQAMIISVMLYFILRLLSGNTNHIEKMVKGETFLKLKKDFEELKNQFKRMTRLLEKKNILLEPLNTKELEAELKQALDDKGINEFLVITKKIIDDTKIYDLKSGKNSFRASIDVYTGELLSFNKTSLNSYQQLGRALKKLVSNKKVFSGVIIALLFTAFMITQLNPVVLSEIESSINIMSPTTGANEFAGYIIQNNTCLSVTDALYIMNNELFDTIKQVSLPITTINSLQVNYPNDYFTDATQISYDNTSYLLIYSKLITEEEFTQATQTYLQQNLLNALQGNIDFCDIKYNGRSISNYIRICTTSNSVCECKLMKDATQYCSVFSELLANQVQSELGGLSSLMQAIGGAIE